jgi:hypothetical protein
MFELMFYLGIDRDEFMKMGRKEIQYLFQQLQEKMDAYSKAGSPGRNTLAANDPMVQSMLPNQTGRHHSNPRNIRP